MYCDCVLDLNAEGNVYTIESIDAQSAGVYQCFVDNNVKPAVVSNMRIHVLCELLYLN